MSKMDFLKGKQHLVTESKVHGDKSGAHICLHFHGMAGGGYAGGLDGEFGSHVVKVC